jgi:arsenite methyltransferase
MELMLEVPSGERGPMASSATCCAPLAGPKISPQDAAATATLFKALSDPTRVRIVNLLSNNTEPVCLCEINDHFDLGQPTMSHHLKKLAAAGLLTRQQRGTWAYFSINRDAFRRLADVTTPREAEMSAGQIAATEEITTEEIGDIREHVRERYAEAARVVTQGTRSAEDRAGCCGESQGGCCGEPSTTCCGDTNSFGSELYEISDRRSLPEAAVLASLGCGNPTAVAELKPGETVLDLGSGGGIDVLLSARRVGPTGKAYGLDMTDEMLALALENKANAGIDNAEFLKGYIEAIPLPANMVDVVISNCVVNLAADKQRVFTETFRVLRPGGRIGISDVVSSNELSPSQRAEKGSYVGCIAGALSFSEYEAGLEGAGFENISITPTHEVAEGMHSAIVRGNKPGAP